MVDYDTSEPMFLDSWRCAECGGLMYNVDAEGRPTPGAPIGIAINIDGKRERVCSMCASLYIAVSESRYMVEQHMAWDKEQDRRKERLGVRGKYLDSDN